MSPRPDGGTPTVRVEERPAGDPLAVAAVAAYCAELDRRFPGGFDPGPLTARDLASLTRPRGCFLVGVSEGQPVACGGVRRLDTDTLEIKRMWVHAAWRGAGLGSRVLRRLEELAAELGGRRVVLDTHRTLTEAMALYERAGYREVPRYNVDNPHAQAWYAKSLPTGH